MAESIEDRLDYVEAQVISLSDVETKLKDIKEVLGRVSGILHDLTKDRDDADEYAEDIDRIDALVGLL
ncbi:hypothetical protein ACFVAJ_11195 [Agromyces sp. NPDC057679]|uniref:hypothetical protein n=1 Tax=Agromyces sp. NPDC057679 TaxID=3346207 RepID=UPI00366A9F6A